MHTHVHGVAVIALLVLVSAGVLAQSWDSHRADAGQTGVLEAPQTSFEGLLWDTAVECPSAKGLYPTRGRLLLTCNGAIDGEGRYMGEYRTVSTNNPAPFLTRVYGFDPDTGNVNIEEDIHSSPEALSPVPAYEDGVLYVSIHEEGVFSYNLTEGEKTWLTRFDDPRPSTPTLAENRVYVSTERRTLALDRSAGTQVWNHTVAEDEAEPRPVYAFAPLLVDDRVVTRDPENVSRLLAFHTWNGEVAWTYEFNATVEAWAAGDSRLVAAAESSLVSLSAAGTLGWTQTDLEGATSSLVVRDDRVLRQTGSSLTAYNVANGTQEWRYEAAVGGLDEPLAVTSGTAFVPGGGDLGGAGVRGINLSTGALQWGVPARFPEAVSVGPEVAAFPSQGGEPQNVTLTALDVGQGGGQAGAPRIANVSLDCTISNETASLAPNVTVENVGEAPTLFEVEVRVLSGPNGTGSYGRPAQAGRLSANETAEVVFPALREAAEGTYVFEASIMGDSTPSSIRVTGGRDPCTETDDEGRNGPEPSGSADDTWNESRPSDGVHPGSDVETVPFVRILTLTIALVTAAQKYRKSLQ